MGAKTTAPLSGRLVEAARHHPRLLEASRLVFTADPGAPISAVAAQAGVGISALYRRYHSKDELLQRLSAEGLRRYIAEVEAALADNGDPWNAFAGFMRRSLDAGTGSLTVRFAGAFPATDELRRLGRIAFESTQRLLARAQAAGAVRADITGSDLSLLFEQLQALHVGDEQRTQQVRHRSLALLLDALHAPPAEPLPGPPPSWDEIGRRYER
jgi:AcrR family transcriptional regulator